MNRMQCSYSNVGYYVMSCDKTSDVANYFVKSFKKVNTDQNLPIYFGVNNYIENATELNAIPIKSISSNWQRETLNQLKLIKKEYPLLTHLIVLLDDFIFLKPHHEHFINLVFEGIQRNVKYLRFTPIEEGIIFNVYNYFIKTKSDFRYGDVIEIRKSHPYYSSLQVALWDINYLIQVVSSASSIWDFENQKTDAIHYSTLNKFIFYKHIVEKGEWDLNAENICIKYLGSFNAGSRKIRVVNPFKRIKIFVQNISFYLVGYLFLNIRNKSEI